MNAAALALKRICASRLNYWLAFVLDFATAAVALGSGVSTAHEPIYGLFTFMTGAFIFTFIEYGMHRWLFHAPASFATTSHHAHHVSPHQPSAMPFMCGPLGGALIWLATTTLLGHDGGALLTSGVMCSYFYYGILHDLQHRIHVKRWLKARWRAHAIHHGTVNRNYGVTTSRWDRVFGTYSSERQRSA
jgi:4-hydroxysphinganine ceramide fatty acyl 2-hydroxylase